MFRSRAVGPGPGCGRAIWSTKGGYGPVGAWDQTMGLDNQFGLGLGLYRSGWEGLGSLVIVMGELV